MTRELRLDPESPAGIVISALRDRIDPARPPMLIGAEARDIIHSQLGHEFQNRATRDVDLAFAVHDWQAYGQLVEGLEAIPDTKIAFRVDGVHVDFMAFGSIESPPGTVTPPFRRSDPMDVVGMAQVYASAQFLRVDDVLKIRIPTLAGYIALKLKAWIDRSADLNYKDAPDLGLALYWAAESSSVTDRVWADLDTVSRWEADVGLAGAAVLGEDVRSTIGPETGDALVNLFTSENRELLAHSLASAPAKFHLGDRGRRLALINALTDGIRG